MNSRNRASQTYAFNNTQRQRLLGFTCVLIVCGLLTAGLWPFNPLPKNEVSWLAGHDGLRFGENGTIFSSEPFQSLDHSPCAIELRLQPAAENDANTILAFYTPDRQVQFSINQYTDSLALHEDPPQGSSNRSSELWIGHVFRGKKLLFLTVSSDTHETKVYLNGELARTSQSFRLSTDDLTGELVVGTSPVRYATWAGDLLGLAVYRHAVQGNDVTQGYPSSGTSNSRRYEPSLSDATAVYRFDEETSSTVHNSVPGPDLLIPKHFVILHKPLLIPPWKEFHSDVQYVKDLAINIAGFMPFGFAFCAYLKLNRRGADAAMAAILTGAAISLIIEVLQAYIPSRASGMTDVITNTTGTALGVAFQSSRSFSWLLERIGLGL